MDMKKVAIGAGLVLAGVVVGSIVLKMPEAKKFDSEVELVGLFKLYVHLEC